MPKKWYTSKTIYIGLLSVLISAIEFVQSHPGIGLASAVLGVLTIVNRFLTTQPIE